jgi:hypothetical protein
MTNATESISDSLDQPFPVDNVFGGGGGQSIPQLTGSTYHDFLLPTSLNGRIAVCGASFANSESGIAGTSITPRIEGVGGSLDIASQATQQNKKTLFLRNSMSSAPFICNNQTIRFLLDVVGNFGGAVNINQGGTAIWLAVLPENWGSDFLITRMSSGSFTTTTFPENPLNLTTVDIDRTGGADLVNDRIDLDENHVYLANAEFLFNGSYSGWLSSDDLQVQLTGANIQNSGVFEFRTGLDDNSTSQPVSTSIQTLLKPSASSASTHLYLGTRIGTQLTKYSVSVIDLGLA